MLWLLEIVLVAIGILLVFYFVLLYEPPRYNYEDFLRSRSDTEREWDRENGYE